MEKLRVDIDNQEMVNEEYIRTNWKAFGTFFSSKRGESKGECETNW